MIKIFSIKEIVDASEGLLKSQNQKIDKNLNLNNIQNKISNPLKSFDKPLVLKKELEITDEVTNNNYQNINEEQKKQNSKLNTNNENYSDRQQIVNELYMLFNKKVKKSTIKIIIDQQKEIKELRNNLSELRKKDYQNLKINKELKDKISDLVNNEKILNLKITQIQNKLENSIEKETELKNINKNLEADLLEMKKSLSSIKEINKAIENAGKLEVYQLERNVSVIATIAGAAPMIGFLGTVIGMIVAIHEIANAGGQIDIKLLSDGLYTAMTTTVAGLIVGIIAYITYNHIVVRTDKVMYQMEAKTVEFLDLLNEPV